MEPRGRYYNLGGVLDGLNNVLAAIEREERFIPIETEGVVAFVAFAPERKFLELAEEFRIPIQIDPDAQVLSGRVYTNHVLASKK